MSHFPALVFVSDDISDAQVDLEKLTEAMIETLEKYNIENNPDGHFDSWELDEIIEVSDRDQFLKDFEKGLIANAIVDTNGVWIEGPYIYKSYGGDLPTSAYTAWKEQMINLMEKYKTATIFTINCHI